MSRRSGIRPSASDVELSDRYACSCRWTGCAARRLVRPAVRRAAALEMGLVVVLIAPYGARTWKGRAVAGRRPRDGRPLGRPGLVIRHHDRLKIRRRGPVVLRLLVSCSRGAIWSPPLRGGRGDGDRPGEQGHAPVPGAGLGGRVGPSCDGGTWRRSPWPWPPIGIALVLRASYPCLAGGRNGSCQLTMARAIGGRDAADKSRAVPAPESAVPAACCRPCAAAPRSRMGARSQGCGPVVVIGVAADPAPALAYLSGGKAHHVIGSVPILIVVGGIVMDGVRLPRGDVPVLGRGCFLPRLVLSGALIASLTLAAC